MKERAMNRESTHVSLPTYRPGRIWIWIVAILVLLPFVGIAVTHLVTGRALERRLNQIRGQGIPVTLEELNDSYTLPLDAANAADLYLEAFNWLQEWSKEHKERLPVAGNAPLPARTEPISECNQTLIREYLKDNQETLKILHEAAALRHARYPIDLTQGFNASSPWLLEAVQCARLLKLEALMYLEQGDAEHALESVRTGIALCQSLKRPVLARIIHEH